MPERKAVALPTKAWHYRRAHVFFWTAVIIVLAADLASKWWAFNYLPLQPTTSPAHYASQPTARAMTIIPGLLEFKTTLNEGAVFGLGKGLRWIFVAATFIAMWFLFRLFATSRANQWFLHTLIALSVAGALGNLYDRLVYGVVRDFIHITARIGPFDVWPAIFNLADAALVIGIGLLMAGWVFGYLDMERADPYPADTPDATDTRERSHAKRK